MSRIGNKPILLGEKVKVNSENNLVKVSGPLGELEYSLPAGIKAEISDGKISLSRKNEERKIRVLHGLARALIANMAKGVTDGFSKTLEINGLGYRANAEKDKLILQVGFSHPVEFPFPEGIRINVDKNRIVVKGVDKQLVGEVAAEIRQIRPPEPYKGTGIKYADEQVRKKVGKAIVSTTAAGGGGGGGKK